jgi:hypothetical protein
MSIVARRGAVAVAVLIASMLASVVAPLVASAIAPTSAIAPAAVSDPQSRAELHDSMRKLWLDHATWTRQYIISVASGLPDKDATTQRLLQNQTDIGAVMARYYGDEVGAKLTGLLKEHILTAGELIAAAKSGNASKTDSANTKWHANADEIAEFQHHANPNGWATGRLRTVMYTHCDQTFAELEHRLNKDYAADIQDHDTIEQHLLMMADMLTDGIVAQFPGRFGIAKKGG